MFEMLKQFDRDLLLTINGYHHHWVDPIMWFLSMTWPTILIVLAVGAYFYRRSGGRRALEFVLGCAIVFACTDLTSNAIKHTVKRYRPTHNLEIREKIHTVNDYRGGKYTFFSGHSANTFGVITFLFLALQHFPVRKRIWIFLYPLLVVYSRMYLGVHYPSDILTGMVDGLLFGSVIFYVMNKYFYHNDEELA